MNMQERNWARMVWRDAAGSKTQLDRIKKARAGTPAWHAVRARDSGKGHARRLLRPSSTQVVTLRTKNAPLPSGVTAPSKRPTKEQNRIRIATMRHAYAATLGIDLRTADRKQRERIRQEAPAWFAGQAAR